MIEINLLPVREARRAADVRRQLLQVVFMLIIVGSGIYLVHTNINDRITNSQARVAQMQRDIDQFKPQLEQVARFRKKKAELEKKIDVIDELDRARSGPVRVMTELASRTPERLWLRSLSTQGSTIHLKGSSLDNELVAVFLRGLGDSAVFDQVDLDGTKLERSKGDLKIVSFTIRAEIVTGNEPDEEEPPAAATAS